MFADWSCKLLVHKRTCCGKYRNNLAVIDLCNSLIPAHAALNDKTRSSASGLL